MEDNTPRIRTVDSYGITKSIDGDSGSKIKFEGKLNNTIATFETERVLILLTF